MRSTAGVAAAVGVLSALAGRAGADVTYLLQDRSISATTSCNGQVQALVAPGFGPFVESLNLQTTFPALGGGTGENMAGAGIDCQLDPNAIRVVGSLNGAGGMSVIGGTPVLQFGEAQAVVNVSFHVDSTTPLSMFASPRPSTRAGDRFRIRLKDDTTHAVLFELDENSPPQAVSMTGVLEPGDLSLEYQVEMTIDGPETSSDFSFSLAVGPAACYANCDASTSPPLLNVSDFMCFMTSYALGEARANCDGSTTPPVLNINDFICFHSKFAAGCSLP